MPAQKLKAFLDEAAVKYNTISHPPAFDAQHVAANAHVSGKELAKSVVVRVDDRYAMAVLPASQMVHLGHLKKALSAEHAELATESEVERLFPDCERGAVPPFGNLYDLEVYVAEELAEDEEIAFSAGTHKELFRMAYRDYKRLVHPRVLALT